MWEERKQPGNEATTDHKGHEVDYWDDQNSSRTRNKSFRLALTHRASTGGVITHDGHTCVLVNLSG